MASKHRITLRLKAALGLLPKVAQVTVNTLAYSTDRHNEFMEAIERAEEARFYEMLDAENTLMSTDEPVIICNPQIEKTPRGTDACFRRRDHRFHNLKKKVWKGQIGRGPRSLRDLNALLPLSA